MSTQPIALPTPSRRGLLAGLLASSALVVAGAPARAQGATLEGTSKIEAVTVYPDGATVTRRLMLDLKPGETVVTLKDLPRTLDQGSIRVTGQGPAGLSVGSVEIVPPRPLARPANANVTEAAIEKLRIERGAAEDMKVSAQLRRQFAERYLATVSGTAPGEKGDNRPVDEIRNAATRMAQDAAAAAADMRELDRQIARIDREVARLTAELAVRPPDTTELRIALSALEAGKADIDVAYAVPQARWSPLYDAKLTTGTAEKPATIEFVRRAEIRQATGEDWTDVALTVSTTRLRRGAGAPALRPLIVRLFEPRPPVVLAPSPSFRGAAPEAAVPQAAPPPAAATRPQADEARARVAARETEAETDTQGLTVVWRVPGRVSVPAGEAGRTLRLASAEAKPELIVRAAPAVEEAAFLEATFKLDEPVAVLPGRVLVNRDGAFVGEVRTALRGVGEEIRLGFGVDDRVKVERSVTRRREGRTGVVTSSSTELSEFKITVRSAHQRPIRVEIEDVVPVSESQELVVEPLPNMTAPTERNVDDRRGVLQWAYELKPGETREIRHGYRLRWPADRRITYEGGRS